MFEWDALGYRLADEPPLDLTGGAALKHDNPWIVLAGVLEGQKRGDFDSLPLLIDCFLRSNDLTLWRACFDLLGDAGSLRLQHHLTDRLREQLFADEDLAYQVHMLKAASINVLGRYSRHARNLSQE